MYINFWESQQFWENFWYGVSAVLGVVMTAWFYVSASRKGVKLFMLVATYLYAMVGTAIIIADLAGYGRNEVAGYFMGAACLLVTLAYFLGLAHHAVYERGKRDANAELAHQENQ